MPTFPPAPLGEDLFLIQGRQPILNLAPALQELSRRTDQLGAMHWLEYFLDPSSLVSKPPYLVVQLRHPSAVDPLHADNILAAALFFEYCIAGVRTGVFCTDDAVGFRSVIAPRDERAHFAKRAASVLLEKGAHIVLTTYESPQDTESPPKSLPGTILGLRQRTVGRMLKLAPTYDETLAKMGHRTRRNLRYYRRHLGTQLQMNFVADARAELTFAEFMRLNNASRNPVRRERELWLRWRSSCRVAGGFIEGLRSAEGEWLALLGGWRHETMTVLHWQLNIVGYEHDSIGIVMRSFFLEDEIARGARRLLMFGGTPHSIRHAFDEESISDLVLCRPTLRSALLRLVAHPLMQHNSLARRNHLLQTLAVLPLSRYGHSSAQLAPSLQQPSPKTSEAS